MSLDHLQPFAGNHAVQQATFVLQWQPVEGLGTNAAIDEAFSALQAGFLAAGLPEVKELRGLKVNVPPQRGSTPTAIEQMLGFEGKLRSEDGKRICMQASVTAEEGFNFQVFEYTRWSVAFEKLRALLKAVILPLASHITLQRIGLQVTDTFNWAGPIEEMPTGEIFRKPSKWIPEHAFGCRTYWHAHHGFFGEPINGIGTRLLTNINVNLMSQKARPLLQAILSHTLEIHDGSVWIRNDADIDRIAEVFLSLHQDNKAKIGDLFSDDVVKKISLWN